MGRSLSDDCLLLSHRLMLDTMLPPLLLPGGGGSSSTLNWE
jgi:hypothetical protein